MAGDSGKTDFAALDKTVIGICDGDGIGPIIMKQAEDEVARLYSDMEKKYGDCGTYSAKKTVNAGSNAAE